MALDSKASRISTKVDVLNSAFQISLALKFLWISVGIHPFGKTMSKEEMFY